MNTLKIQLPDSLYQNLEQLAAQDGILIEQFIALAVAEKISALTTESYLQERGKRGDQARYKAKAILAKVPDVEPEIHDKLPSV